MAPGNEDWCAGSPTEFDTCDLSQQECLAKVTEFDKARYKGVNSKILTPPGLEELIFNEDVKLMHIFVWVKKPM